MRADHRTDRDIGGKLSALLPPPLPRVPHAVLERKQRQSGRRQSFPRETNHMPLKRIRNNLIQLGTLNGSLYLLDYALRKLSAGRAYIKRYYLVAQPVQDRPACRPSTKNPVVFLEPGSPLALSFPRPPEIIAKRINDGAHCFVALSGEEFAGFLWLAFNAYDEDEVRCRYELADPQHCVWDYDVHVEPKYRIGRTFARLWDSANAHLSRHGVSWSISRISAFNPASLAAHGRLGIRTLFSANFLCLGPIQITIISAAPWFHVSLSPSSRPCVRLQAPKCANERSLSRN